MEYSNEILTVDITKRLHVNCYTEGGQGFVLLSDQPIPRDGNTFTLDLVAARRLAIALLCAAEDATPVGGGR